MGIAFALGGNTGIDRHTPKDTSKDVNGLPWLIGVGIGACAGIYAIASTRHHHSKFTKDLGKVLAKSKEDEAKADQELKMAMEPSSEWDHVQTKEFKHRADFVYPDDTDGVGKWLRCYKTYMAARVRLTLNERWERLLEAILGNIRASYKDKLENSTIYANVVGAKKLGDGQTSEWIGRCERFEQLSVSLAIDTKVVTILKAGITAEAASADADELKAAILCRSINHIPNWDDLKRRGGCKSWPTVRARLIRHGYAPSRLDGEPIAVSDIQAMCNQCSESELNELYHALPKVARIMVVSQPPASGNLLKAKYCREQTWWPRSYREHHWPEFLGGLHEYGSHPRVLCWNSVVYDTFLRGFAMTAAVALALDCGDGALRAVKINITQDALREVTDWIATYVE